MSDAFDRGFRVKPPELSPSPPKLSLNMYNRIIWRIKLDEVGGKEGGLPPKKSLKKGFIKAFQLCLWLALYCCCCCCFEWLRSDRDGLGSARSSIKIGNYQVICERCSCCRKRSWAPPVLPSTTVPSLLPNTSNLT